MIRLRQAAFADGTSNKVTRLGGQDAPRKTQMVIGILTIRLGIEYAHSLKDKRQVVKSLKERVRGRFNVGIAEVADLDTWNRATLGAVSVSNDQNRVRETLNHVVNYIEADGRATLEDFVVDVQPYAPAISDDKEWNDDDFGFLDGDDTA